MVKHTQTVRRQQSTNCLSVFDHFVGLALKGLTNLILHYKLNYMLPNSKHGSFSHFVVHWLPMV